MKNIKFVSLAKSSGLSQREMVAFLGLTSPRNLRAWLDDEYAPPDAVIAEIATLVSQQRNMANAMIEQLKLVPKGAEIEIGYPVDDHEAQSLGFPCLTAWRVSFGIIEAWARSQVPPINIIAVPRGSSPATAAAIDAHEPKTRKP